MTLLAQNHVVGCSVLINRALLELATPVPEAVHMQDWWLALCAGFGGAIGYLPEPLVRYRQHGKNQIGAMGVKQRLLRPSRLPAWVGKMNRIYGTVFVQAEQLRERLRARGYAGSGPTTHGGVLDQLDSFLALRSRSRLLRPWYLARRRVRRQNPFMTALFYLQAMTLPIP